MGRTVYKIHSLKSDKYKRFELSTKSLREHLITIRELLAEAAKVEMFPDMSDRDMTEAIINSIKLHDRFDWWTIPYPYNYPAWKMVCDAKFGDSSEATYQENLTPELDFEICQIVAYRINSQLHYAVPEDLVAEVDSSYEYGAIVHKITGRIVTFNYSALDHVLVVGIPISILRIILRSKPDKFPGDEEDRLRLLDYTFAHRRKYNAWYEMSFGYNNGNDHTATPWMGLSDKTPLTNDDLISLIEYLQVSLPEHRKVLCVT